MTAERDDILQNPNSISSEKLMLPANLKDLAIKSLSMSPIGNNIQLFPGLRLIEQLVERRPSLLQLIEDETNEINGRYGIRYIDPLSNRATARAGFEIFETEGGYLFVTHPPQGLPEGTISRAEGARLKEIDFRRAMMRKILDIAKALRLEKVEAQRAVFSEKYLSGLISLEDAKKFYDAPCRGEYNGQKFKYKQGEDGRWVYRLK